MAAKVIFLEGVACIGKTSLLRRLASQYTVGFHDYAEYRELTGGDPGKNYTSWHADKTKLIERGFIDRSPYANDLYTLVYDVLNNKCKKPDDFDERLRAIPVTKYPNEMTIIFLPANEESYPVMVENMKKRANGIDRLDIEYVRAQTIVFREYAVYNNLFVVYIDFSDTQYIQKYYNLYRLLCTLIK